MSKSDDRWLDICTLLRGIEDEGEIVIIPERNAGHNKKLSFSVLKSQVFGDVADVILTVLNLADSFEFFITNDRLTVSVRIDVFKS